MAQSRFRPPPGARTCAHMLHARPPFPDRCASVFSFLLFSFFFLHPFFDCTKLKSIQPLAALCTDSLHSTPLIYLGNRKNARSTTKVTSRNLVNTPKSRSGRNRREEEEEDGQHCSKRFGRAHMRPTLRAMADAQSSPGKTLEHL